MGTSPPITPAADAQALVDVAGSLETIAQRLEAEWLKLPVFDPDCDDVAYEKQRKTRRFLMDIYAKQAGESMARLLGNKWIEAWPLGEVVDRHSPGCGRDKQSSLSFFRALAIHVGCENVASDGLTAGGYHHADVMRALAVELRELVLDRYKLIAPKFSYYIGFTYHDRAELICCMVNELREGQVDLMVATMMARCEQIEPGLYSVRHFREDAGGTQQRALEAMSWEDAVARINASVSAFDRDEFDKVSLDDKRQLDMHDLAAWVSQRIYDGSLHEDDDDADGRGDFPAGRGTLAANAIDKKTAEPVKAVAVTESANCGTLNGKEKPSRRRPKVSGEPKLRFLERCEAGIESGEFDNEARFVDLVVHNNEMSKSKARQWLRDAKKLRESSKQFDD